MPIEMRKISNGDSQSDLADGASAELMRRSFYHDTPKLYGFSEILRDLFRSLKDPVVSVREAVQTSLIELGMKRSDVVISYLHSILAENLKRVNLQ